jgi:drug/metabolite transporter (DMT)-like permease
MRKAFIQLHIAVFLAGFTGILGRLITLNEGLLVWYRLLITSVTLWMVYFLKKRSFRISLKDVVIISGIGAIASLHWVSFYGSIKYANVSVALVCFSSIGFFTAIFEPVVLKKKINRTELLLGFIAICGIYLVFHFDPAYKTGIIFGIFSAMLGSLYPVLNRKILKRLPAEMVTLYELTGGFVFLSLIVPFYLYSFPTEHIFPTWKDFGWLLVLSWFCTVLAFSLLMNALKKISAFTVNLTYNLEPVYGILLAFIVYREDRFLPVGFFAGLALILLSVCLQTLIVYRGRKNKTD